MENERHRRVQDLYDAAKARAAAAREAFLDAACGPDIELRTQVESMLEASRETRGEEELFRGRYLGPYQILHRLGRGGMGEVYLANDPRLGRKVAVKVLPANRAEDATARERLRREAMAAALLDHPFICKVFETGEDNGAVFIVMECVEGETLHHRIGRGRLAFDETLSIAVEVAEALDEAHGHRLLHRDLKPANIMVTPQGHVKVMDFGLAIQFAAETVGEGDRTGTMLGPPLTAEGSVVGTPDYMSPEQLKGETLDQRSDLFSFGIVLAEMATGKHPFRRGSSMETTTAILRDPPMLGAAGTGELRPGLLVLIHRLVAKSPADRYGSANDLRADLLRLSAGTEIEVPISMKEPAGRIPLIGRAREFDELVSMLGEAVAGRGSLALIGGEPGIGKSHLTRALLAEARRRGVFAAVGQCWDKEGAPPYVPFIEMLEYSARVSPPQSFRYAVGDAAPEVARLMPELRRMFPDIPPQVELPPEQQRRFLFNAYRDYVDRSARLTPVVHVFEDLHWADEATLALFEHLALTAGTSPRLMIATYRDAEVDLSRPFARTLESLLRQKAGVRMPLRRFTVAGVEEMLRALSGREVPPKLAEVIYEGTEGNPFFVEEVFRHLTEEEKLFDANGAWRESLRVDELEVPEGVRLVIGRRLARLQEDTRRVLTTAAVVGRSFGIRLLEEMEGAQSDSVLDAVEEAEQVKLVAAEPGREERYRFVHELVRQTLAETLTQARRQRLHARIADAIEKVHAANPERQASALAHHLFEAGRSADAGKTLKYLTIAAQQAAAAAAYSEALEHLDNALTVVGEDQPSAAASLQVQRAAALRSLMRYPEAIEAYENALTLFAAAGDRVQYAATSIPLGYIHGWALDVFRARVILKRALDHLGDPGSPLSRPLLSLSAACASVGGDMDTALAELEESAKLGAETADPATNAFVWSCEAHTRYHAMQLDRAAEASVKASRAFEAAGDAWGHVDADYVQVFANMFFGKPDELPRFVEEAVRRAERVGHQYSSWACKSGLVYLHVARGGLAEAEAVARENLAFAQSFHCVYGFQSEVALANTLFLRGEVAEANEWFTRAIAPSWPQSAWSGHAASCAAWASAVLGEVGAGEAALQARCRLPGSGREPAIGQWFSLAPVIAALAISGQSEEAAGLLEAAERLVALGAVFTHLMTRTAAGIAAACAGEWTRAEEHHQAAIRQAEALRFHLAGASARAWHAEMLLSRNEAGDKARARSLLAEALAGFEKVGAKLLAGRVSRQLAECGNGSVNGSAPG